MNSLFSNSKHLLRGERFYRIRLLMLRSVQCVIKSKDVEEMVHLLSYTDLKTDSFCFKHATLSVNRPTNSLLLLCYM